MCTTPDHKYPAGGVTRCMTNSCRAYLRRGPVKSYRAKRHAV